MSKKFFSLLHKGAVHIAPKTRVIPSKEFSSLIDAQNVLDLVKKDAKQYKAEVAVEIEQLKEEGKKAGFEEGFSQWIEKAAELEKEIQKVQDDMKKVVVPLALKAAKKILGRELETSESAIVDIIKNSLRAVAQHKKVAIYVNKKDFELVEKEREQLKTVFENLEALSIRQQDDVTEGGCIIETEGGIINAQLENQWLVLENAFQKLLKIEPEKKKTQNKEETT